MRSLRTQTQPVASRGVHVFADVATEAPATYQQIAAMPVKLCLLPSVEFPGFLETCLTSLGGCFEVIRADATDVAVMTPWIVERIDVVGNVDGRHVPGIVDPLLDPFLLEAREEGLGNCIIPAIPSATHAGLKPIFPAEPPPVIAAILASLVRVDDRPVGPTPPHSHHHGIQDQPTMNGRAHRPSDDLA